MSCLRSSNVFSTLHLNQSFLDRPNNSANSRDRRTLEGFLVRINRGDKYCRHDKRPLKDYNAFECVLPRFGSIARCSTAHDTCILCKSNAIRMCGFEPTEACVMIAQVPLNCLFSSGLDSVLMEAFLLGRPCGHTYTHSPHKPSPNLSRLLFM